MNKKELSVVLLLSDLEDVKEISNVFRKTGIIPEYYNDLKTFWHGIMDNMPSICLVDVRMMSEGDLMIKNHPFIKNEQLPILFFYSAETKPLLYSTFEIFNLGLIEQSASYTGQLKCALKRFNKLLKLEKDSYDLSIKNDRLDRQISSMVEHVQKIKEEKHFDQVLKSILVDMEMEKDSDDFFSACNNVFSGRAEIVEYAMLELDHSGQKLISATSSDAKFRKIPTLWLGQKCHHGIEYFAQNMANQVCLDLMGGEVMSLMIKGELKNPDKIIFLRAENEAFLNSFNWESLEKHLTASYLYFKLRNEKSVENEAGGIISPWNLMTVLDQNVFGVPSGKIKSGEISLIDINFTQMINIIRCDHDIRFYWKSFFNEFIGKLKSQFKIPVKVICMGINHIGLVVKKEHSNEFFVGLKAWASKYHYWRYFEDVDLVLPKETRPIIKMVPLSPEAYFKLIEGSGITTYEADQEAKHEEIKPIINKMPELTN